MTLLRTALCLLTAIKSCRPFPLAGPQVDKIRRLKTMCLEKGVNPWIEVDGGVTPDNAWKVRAVQHGIVGPQDARRYF